MLDCLHDLRDSSSIGLGCASTSMPQTSSKVTSPHQKNNLCKRVTDSEVDIKFPHQVMKTLNWPLRRNIDIAHRRRVFYGPKELKGTGPFSVPSL